MNIKRIVWVAPLTVATALVGCAAPYQQQPVYGSTPAPTQSYPSANAQMGYVDRIEVVNRSASSNVAGTVIGGIVGGLIGTQIGGGSGRTAATIAGAVGGAAAGNVIEGRRRNDNETFRVSVRMDNGAYQTITQENINDLRTGDRVRVDGNAIYRI